jgi:hypothetical protein
MTVAGEFDITKENAPTNPAFIDSLAVERSVGGKKQIILATSRKIN